MSRGPRTCALFRLDLLAQHLQFGIIRSRRTREQRHPGDHADQDQVEHPYRHKPAILPAARPPQQEYPQVSQPYPVLEPHTGSRYVTTRQAASSAA
jgi:hypothetical protein